MDADKYFCETQKSANELEVGGGRRPTDDAAGGY